jgi:uncharacterized delta-60 repeat protein
MTSAKMSVCLSISLAALAVVFFCLGCGGGGGKKSAPNDAPVVTLLAITGVKANNVEVDYTLTDDESDRCSIVVQFSIDAGSTWNTATSGGAGDGLSNLTSSGTGTTHVFFWDSRTDGVGLSAQQDDVKIQITPSDSVNTGSAAETDSFSVDNSGTNELPTVAITSGPGEGSTVGTNTVTFTWSGSDTDGTVEGYYYSFDYNPPNIWTVGTSVTSGTLANGAHTFRVVAMDDDNAFSAVASRTFTVWYPLPPPPVADFQAVPVRGAAPLTVRFTDMSTGTITSYAWDFDNDGTTDSTEENPTYTYNSQGTYTAKLTATGPGGSDDETKTITVTAPSAPSWGKSYGGAASDWAYSTQQTRDSGYIVAGHSHSFTAGLNDFWVLKLKSDGSVSWQKRYGGVWSDCAYSIQQTSDGKYIVAGAASSFGLGDMDFWLVKLDGDGTVSWQKRYGGTDNDEAFSVQQTSDDGYIVAGYTNSFGAGLDDFWVLKLDGNGAISWQKTYGGTGDDLAYSIRQTSDGGYIVAGETASSGAGYSDFWVLKLDSDGAISWQKTYGGTGDDVPHSIQQTTDGGYVVAGTYSFDIGRYEFWLLKLSSDGTVSWQKAYSGPWSGWAYSIQQTTDGGYVMAGEIISFDGSSPDFWVLKLNNDGRISWQKRYGGGLSDLAYSIRQTNDGGYIAAGCTEGLGAGYDDFWVLKLNSDGTIPFNSGSSAWAVNTGAVPANTSAVVADTSVTGADTTVTATDTTATVAPTDCTVVQQAP